MTRFARCKTAYILLALTLVLTSPCLAQPNGFNLWSPDWFIFLNSAGYSDFMWMTFPGHVAHENLSGDWAAAIRYDGIPSTEPFPGASMWLTTDFLRPSFRTNSNFFVLGPMTTGPHTPPLFGPPHQTKPTIGSSLISNDELDVQVFVEILALPEGKLVGLNPSGNGALPPVLTSRYVLKQTYRVENITQLVDGGRDITNISFFQFLHGQPNGVEGPHHFGVYDPTFFGAGALPQFHYDIVTYSTSVFNPPGTDLVGFSSARPPDAFSMGLFPRTNGEPAFGLHQEIYADNLRRIRSVGPGEAAGAMKWNLGNLAPGESTEVTVILWNAHSPTEIPPPQRNLYQAFPGNSMGTNRHQMGHAGQHGDTITAVPGILKIVPGGPTWPNFVKAAQEGVSYKIQNTLLKKQVPQIGKCGYLFPPKVVYQHGTPNVRLWWPLMYEIPGTKWTLDISYGTYTPWDSGTGRQSTVHREKWEWELDASLESMKDVLSLFRQVPFGTSQTPLISNERLYHRLQGILDEVIDLVNQDNRVDAGLRLTDFEMEVMDACIGFPPLTPAPGGSGTGIANTEENPACCKLVADADFVGRKLGIFLQSK